jgi:Glycosyl hydrolase family 99
MTRRSFVRSGALAVAGALTAGPAMLEAQRRAPLADRYSDLRRHFVFEYYPWYRTDPWEHWPEGGHHPPADFGSNFVPLLGLYDSRSTAVMEQHARWIAEAGVGAIDVSWWGPDSNVNEIIPTLMDVMGAHDIHVAFYIEPYADTHAQSYARDVMTLIKTYGDRRHWDCFLLHEYEDGKVGPVFKSFRTILPATGTDCHGITSPVGDYAADAVWRRQTDAVRETLKNDFDRVTLLADSLAVDRTQAGGFDGIALFDNYVSTDRWRQAAVDCSSRDLVFSFQINPGFDGIVFPQTDPNTCYKPPAFAPGGGVYDWTRAQDREAAVQASRNRIVESFETTVSLQTSPSSSNAKQGFFLAYINSFNEWHEGHQFEPAKNSRDLTDAERAAAYHNPENGRYRLDALRDLIRTLE